QVEYSNDDLDKEDASKQGRESNKTKSMFQDSDFDVLDDDMEDVEGETVHTATTRVSVVSAPTFIKMMEEKSKERGVAIKDVKDSPRPIRSITTLQPLPTIDPKDKELAQRLHEEELAELDRARKERQKQKESTNAALAEDQQQAESTKKRSREDSEEESSKKHKLEEDNDAEKEELRDSMDVAPRDDVAIDVEFLATKYPIGSIIECFVCKKGNTPVFDQERDRETPKVLLLAWEKFFEIKHACREKQHQPEDLQELLHKLLKDLQIISEELADYINTPNWNCPAFYDNEVRSYTIDNLTVVLNTRSPDKSLKYGGTRFSTIPETESDELIKSSVENLVPIPSESEDFSDIESECDVPVCDNFTTFSNLLFDADDDFSSSDDESFSDEDVPKEIYSNPLFDEEIISTKIDPHHFNFESDLIEYMLNQDTSIISSPKIDSLLEEFSGELAHIDLIPPGINETDFDPEEEIRLVEKLLYDNSSPRPPEEFNSKNSDAIIDSFSPSPILVEDSDSHYGEIEIFLSGYSCQSAL
ncbi:hypothetical protein Tco_1012420, partial [Tanacetum coccineum]